MAFFFCVHLFILASTITWALPYVKWKASLPFGNRPPYWVQYFQKHKESSDSEEVTWWSIFQQFFYSELTRLCGMTPWNWALNPCGGWGAGGQQWGWSSQTPLGVGFVSCSCYYRLPQTSCHERTRIYSLTVLETTSPKSFHWAKIRVWAGMVPSGGSGGKSISLPFPASGECLHASAHDFFLSSLPSLAFIITSPTSSFDLLGSRIQGPLWLHLGPIQVMQDNLLISRSLTQSYL